MDPDDNVTYNVEFLPADWVIYPEWVVPGRTYEVKVGYTKPNGCYLFDRFHSEPDGESVIIAVQTMVRVDSECKKYENSNEDQQTFTFSCNENYNSSNAYYFKFFTGYDVQGNKTYSQIVIPVKP